MKPFDWNPGKNLLLKTLRGLDFNDIITAFNEDGLIDAINHPNQKKYQGQKIFIVKINKYCYSIPFVETEEKIFLKTIIPDRKATKKYLKKGKSI